MGILDDLAMGFGLKEKDRDYYDRTEQTLRRTQGDARGDIYARQTADRRANAPNYSTAIGPSLSDFRRVPTTASNDPYDSSGNLRADYKPGTAAQRYKDVGRPQPGTLPHTLTRSPGILGLLANLFGGYKPIAPQTELPSTYKPMSAAQRAQGMAEINERRRRDGLPPLPTPAAQAAMPGAQAAPVQTSPLIGYGFEEDKFGFNPQTPRATLNDLDIDLNPGYSQMADGQYVPSYNPFEASTAAQAQLAPVSADLELSQWLQTEQGSRYNNPDLPEDFVRRMFETSKRLNAGKF